MSITKQIIFYIEHTKNKSMEVYLMGTYKRFDIRKYLKNVLRFTQSLRISIQ